jgi:subtilisin family serine protease
MNRDRNRVWPVLMAGLVLTVSACAPAYEPARYSTAAYATTVFDSFWWYHWVGIKAAHDKGVTGKGARVAIVDTGLLFDHEDFRPTNLEPGVEFCTGTEGRAEDLRNGHGTELAGIVGGLIDGHATKGVAPDATLIPYKVVCGTTRAAVVYQGVDRAVSVAPRADVLLLALGPWPGDTDASGNSLDELLDLAVRTHPGTLFVVGSVWDAEFFKRPAWTLRPNVVLVAAMTLDASKTREVPYSVKRGDIWAPGRDVETASIEPPGGRPHGRYKLQGTSAAAAIVAGCAALLKQATGHTGAQLRQTVLDASEEADLPEGRRLKCNRRIP